MPKPASKTVRQPNRTLHIYCEGEKTEPNYLEGYIAWRFPGDRSKAVIKIEPTKKNTPVALVKEAVTAKKSSLALPGDEFWVVYDRESIAKYPDKLHDQARQTAQANGIHIALSNVCFELWILLHFANNNAPHANCAELIGSPNFKRALAEIGITSYEKGHAGLFSLLQNSISTARKRAEKMNQATREAAANGATHPYQLNPYTDIHLLLDAIDSFKAKA